MEVVISTKLTTQGNIIAKTNTNPSGKRGTGDQYLLSNERSRSTSVLINAVNKRLERHIIQNTHLHGTAKVFFPFRFTILLLRKVFFLFEDRN